MHSASADDYNARRLSKTQNHSGIQKKAYKHATKEVGFTLEMEIQLGRYQLLLGPQLIVRIVIGAKSIGQFNCIGSSALLGFCLDMVAPLPIGLLLE